MIHELETSACPSVRSLFDDDPAFRLIVPAVLDGAYPGRIWVDDPRAPAAALVGSAQGYDLAGRFDDGLASDLNRLLEDGTLVGEGSPVRRDWATIVIHAGSDEARMRTILGDREMIMVRRRYYRLDLDRPVELGPLPDGYAVRPIDLALLDDPEVKVHPLLTEPVNSGHYDSREAYLEREFGSCVVFQGLTVGHCVINCVHGDACELGVRTEPEHRKRGLAVAVVRDVLRGARERGLARVDWHCDEANVPSIRVAETVGFVHLRDYTFHAVYKEPAMHCIMAGHYHDLAGETEAALACFERAVAMDGCPFFGPARATGAHARLGHDEGALRLLNLAIDRGYHRRELLFEHRHYEALREVEGFEAAILRIPEAPPES